MKKILVILCAALLLTGCAAETFETVDDVYAPLEKPEPASVSLALPENAAAQAMEGDTGTIYFCDGFEVTVEILSSGDVDATLKALTGFGREALSVLQTRRGDADCYVCAWSSAGETGDQVGQAMVLDDGNYHYCICLMTAAESASDCLQAWQEILDSTALERS